MDQTQTIIQRQAFDNPMLDAEKNYHNQSRCGTQQLIHAIWRLANSLETAGLSVLSHQLRLAQLPQKLMITILSNKGNF